MTTKPAIPLVLSCVLAALSLNLSCARTTVTTPVATAYDREDPFAELDYWHGLAQRPIVSNDEAVHGLTLLALGADPSQTYDDRLAIAKQHNWLPQSFNEPASLALQRGTLARALVVIADVKGGVLLQTLGPDPRYALRELADLNIMPDSSPQQTLSGADFAGILARADQYIQSRSAIPIP